MASIKFSFKFEYGFCSTYDNQDGKQNGRRLLVSAVVVNLLLIVIFNWILRNFIYGWRPSISPSSSNTHFVRQAIIKMANKMAATYQCPLLWSL